MPSKKPRKRKKKVDPPNLDFSLFFTDNTIIESGGDFEKTKTIMENDSRSITVSSRFAKASLPYSNPCPEEWTIKTNLNIVSQFGEGYFTLDMKSDRSLYIVQYMGSTDVYFNHDLSCLSRWAQANGWNIPRPTEALVKDNLQFWKHMWEVLLIDSDYLDQRYGIRKSLDMRTAQDMSDRMETEEEE